MFNASTAGGTEHIRPLDITVQIDGCSVTVTPMVLQDLPRFTELVLPFMGTTASKFDAGIADRLKSGDLTDADLVNMVTAIAVNGEQMIDLLVLCTKQHWVLNDDPKEFDSVPVTGAAHEQWIRQLLLDRAVELLATCIQVNVDFFSQAVRHIKALASQLRTAGPASSATPRPSSS